MTDPAALRVHVWRMVRVYEDYLWRQGASLPGELSALLALVVPNGAQRGTESGSSARKADAVPVTYREAARMLGCSTRTVGRMTRDGRLRAVGEGSGRRIPASEVEAYLRGRSG